MGGARLEAVLALALVEDVGRELAALVHRGGCIGRRARRPVRAGAGQIRGCWVCVIQSGVGRWSASRSRAGRRAGHEEVGEPVTRRSHEKVTRGHRKVKVGVVTVRDSTGFSGWPSSFPVEQDLAVGRLLRLLVGAVCPAQWRSGPLDEFCGNFQLEIN